MERESGRNDYAERLRYYATWSVLNGLHFITWQLRSVMEGGIKCSLHAIHFEANQNDQQIKNFQIAYQIHQTHG